MSYYGTMQVVDGTGWSKTFSLEKALTLIGSASFNDVVLSDHRGSGVAAAHLQLIRTQAGARGFRLVNLVSQPLPMSLSRARGEAVVPPNGSRDLEDGDMVRVGDFAITFYLRAANGVSIEKRSENLGIRLEMPGVSLQPGVKLAGLLTVMNFGEEKRSQFEIELEGLPSDCFQIDPAPLLYPGGEEKLQIRFYHRGIRPPAGACSIRLRASAVGAYPTEELILPLVLDVEPVYQYRVDLMDEDRPVEAEFEPILPLPQANVVEIETGFPVRSETYNPVAVSTGYVTAPPEPVDPSKGIPVSVIGPVTAVQAGLNHAPEIAPDANSRPFENPAAVQPLATQPDADELELDWWTEASEEPPAAVSSDLLAGLKRGARPRLSVEKTNIQVLKATPEDLYEQKDESQPENPEQK